MSCTTWYSVRNISDNQHQIRDEALDAHALGNNDLFAKAYNVKESQILVGLSKNDSLWPETWGLIKNINATKCERNEWREMTKQNDTEQA